MLQPLRTITRHVAYLFVYWVVKPLCRCGVFAKKWCVIVTVLFSRQRNPSHYILGEFTWLRSTPRFGRSLHWKAKSPHPLLPFPTRSIPVQPGEFLARIFGHVRKASGTIAVKMSQNYVPYVFQKWVRRFNRRLSCV